MIDRCHACGGRKTLRHIFDQWLAVLLLLGGLTLACALLPLLQVIGMMLGLGLVVGWVLAVYFSDPELRKLRLAATFLTAAGFSLATFWLLGEMDWSSAAMIGGFSLLMGFLPKKSASNAP